MDNYGEDGEQKQQVRPGLARPLVVGMVLLAIVLLAGALGSALWKLGRLPGMNPVSTPPAPIQMSIEPTASSGDTLTKEYNWRHDGSDWSLTMAIPEYLYLYYSQMKRAPVEDYSIYVTHPKDDKEVTDRLAAELKSMAVKKGYDPEETVNFAASFVQNLDYRLEDEEYPNYPVQTLVEQSGDCEDTAILTAAILQAMGYDAVLIRFTSPVEGEAGHMAVGVAVTGMSGGYSYSYDGRPYYYLETTSAWPLGDMPDDILNKYDGMSDAIYQLAPAPALRFTGDLNYTIEGRWLSDKTADISVTVTNWGTADANDFRVRAFFEGHESGAKSSTSVDLAYGYQVSGVVVEDIVVPSGEGTLLVQLCLDGVVVDDWTAEIS